MGSETHIKKEYYLGKEIMITIDRAIGSKHPKHGFVYECNYGYVPNTLANDGEEVDAYILGVNEPVSTYTGVCIAIVHRLDDNEDKLIVVPKGLNLTDEAITKSVAFQEKWFKSVLVRS